MEEKEMKKKIVAFALSVLSLMTCSFTACGGKKDGYDPLNPDQIKLVLPNLGFGTDQFRAIAKAFENTHPGKTVFLEETIVSSALISQLEAGSFIGDVCMFTDDMLWKKWRSMLHNIKTKCSNLCPYGEYFVLSHRFL